MPEPNQRDLRPEQRLQPSLLDRLTDDEPKLREESREKRVLDGSELQRVVIRDLDWLLNTKAPPAASGFERTPRLGDSVLNYGFSGYWDLSASSVGDKDVEKSVKKAIHRFEPRIVKETLKVSFVKDNDKDAKGADPFTRAFEIKGDILAEPVQELLLKTKLDLTLTRCFFGRE